MVHENEVEFKSPAFVEGIVPKFVYQKSSHLSDWLKQTQSSERCDIPEYVINRIRYECKANWIEKPEELTTLRIRKWLKKYKLTRYAEHIPYIRHRLTGARFEISKPIQRKLFYMFEQVQIPYEKFKPHDRKAFLSYPYILNKFFLMLDLPQYMHYFPLLKNREKLYRQERIFRKICQELNWPFIPST